MHWKPLFPRFRSFETYLYSPKALLPGVLPTKLMHDHRRMPFPQFLPFPPFLSEILTKPFPPFLQGDRTTSCRHQSRKSRLPNSDSTPPAEHFTNVSKKIVHEVFGCHVQKMTLPAKSGFRRETDNLYFAVL